MKRRVLPFVAALSVLSGCAALPARVDASGYASMSCMELDNAIGDNAKAITQLALDRGRAAGMSIPAWLLGASATVEAVNERRSARIMGLQEQQAAMKAARARAC